ncbi:Disease resistance protein (TIR-NBS-LRR class) [Quillaja saponaria]|uniref:ADP-ribosyl cyclase/cyclic ADP-ribose hydrolase n=1 Tax=Quillaja saponaria TaxID=32244 RepID=A0AAD7L4R2_QUISA|nr:Disease resistance protein (TIR-NBS-LRR class) [Quillaja saponaria]
MAVSLPRVRKYDVFICFRGADARFNFISRLHSTLRRKQIEYFIEFEIHVSTEEVYERLFRAIEESVLSVVIFSENFASSKWCLDEVVKIHEWRKRNAQVVIPVFYNVDPENVRHQTGTYAEAIERYELDLNDHKSRVHKWRHALSETANLPGVASSTYRLESEFINGIVKDILEKLGHMTAYDSKSLVGIEKHIFQVEALLHIDSSDVCIIVGIWGIGGIGKTTIATGVYCKHRYRFDECYFVENVRENSEKLGVIYLRNKLLSQILDERIHVSTPELPTSIKEKLRHKKVFIVLDDVNNVTQLEYLAGEGDLFDFGSRIIVTTRDKHILNRVEVNAIYDAKGLDWNEALELFSLRAFDRNCPLDALTDLSERIVHHATGVPLVLNILGSFLYGRSMEEWKSALENIENGPFVEMFDVLKLSYDALSQDEKNLFLDIACFFKGEDIDFVKRISNACGFLADRGIHSLMEKSLVTIANNIIEVHASIQDLGQEIIHRQHLQEPGKRSRLWDPEHVHHIFRFNSGTEAVEGIFLDMSKVKEIELSPKAFTRMSNLRLLKFYAPSYHENCKLYVPQVLEYLPNELRYLHWHGYPLKSLPSSFCPEKLVELHMPYSNVEELWKGIQLLPFLYKIDLSYSRHLIGIPDLSRAPNLCSINLEFCTSLLQIHESIQYLDKLGHLNLNCCEKLRSLPSHINLKSLEVLDLRRCSNLQVFPLIVGSMNNLVSLVLDGCESLRSLPSSINMLNILTNISLVNCTKLEKLPDIFASMVRLKSLRLKATEMKKLPSSVSHLVGLKILSIEMCKNLKFIPNISGMNCLETLSLSGCENIEKLPRLAGLSSLVELNLSGCCNLLEIPDDIGSLSSLSSLSLKGSKIVRIPASIKDLSRLYHLDLTDCTRLKFLLELPPFLQYLYATNCISLEMVSSSKVALTSHKLTKDRGNNLDNVHLFDFTGCLELDQESCSNIMVDAQIRIQHMAKLSRKQSPSLTVCFPGNEIPDLFAHRTDGSCLTIKLSSGWCNERFLGFALCVVAEFKGRGLEDFSLQCGLKINNGNIRKYNSPCLWYGTRFVDSHHTILWYDHVFHNQTMKEIKNGYHSDEILFDFYSINDYDFVYSWEVVKCGICLLYKQDAEELDKIYIDDDDDDDEEEGEEEEEEERGVGE